MFGICLSMLATRRWNIFLCIYILDRKKITATIIKTESVLVIFCREEMKDFNGKVVKMRNHLKKIGKIDPIYLVNNEYNNKIYFSIGLHFLLIHTNIFTHTSWLQWVKDERCLLTKGNTYRPLPALPIACMRYCIRAQILYMQHTQMSTKIIKNKILMAKSAFLQNR